jgi:uncharacterized protein YegP (UPF0339 family)
MKYNTLDIFGIIKWGVIMYFILYKDSQGQWRWNYNSANHKIIAMSSEAYINKQDAINSINLVKTGAATAGVYDKTQGKWI